MLSRLFDDRYFFGLFVDLRLEGEFFLLFLLTLDPELLQLFVLLLLQLGNSLMNGFTVFKFLKINHCESGVRFGLVEIVM